MVPTICLLNIMTRRRLLLCIIRLTSRFSPPDILSLVFIVQISDRKWIELMAISDNFINWKITDEFFCPRSFFFFCPRRSIYMYYVLISADVSLAITWCSTCKNLACVMWRSGFFSHLKINRTFDAPRNVASMFSKILFWRSDNLTLDELCRPRFWHKVGLYAVGFRLSEEFYATVILPLQNVHVFNVLVRILGTF